MIKVKLIKPLNTPYGMFQTGTFFTRCDDENGFSKFVPYGSSEIVLDMAFASENFIKEHFEKVPQTFNVEISEDEFILLQLILPRIGGCTRTSMRKHADNLQDKLFDLQLRYHIKIPDFKSVVDLKSSCGRPKELGPAIYFKDHSAKY